jgi:hypothetical protein
LFAAGPAIALYRGSARVGRFRCNIVVERDCSRRVVVDVPQARGLLNDALAGAGIIVCASPASPLSGQSVFASLPTSSAIDAEEPSEVD